MLSTADFKKGLRILIDRDPYEVMDHTVQTPTARGSATLVKCRVRHILTGAVQDRTFKAGEKFEEPDLQLRPVQFLYRDGEDFHFMDLESYEQFHLGLEGVGAHARWLTDGAGLRSVLFNGSVAGIEMPQFMEFEIESTEPAVRGDTASGRVMKDATLATGAVVKVPLYMEPGERILVATETGEFVKRVSAK
ncbi:MAG TPA: elongation factor P [Candidatus Polarisedimenticolia bacterium]|nr:elongation factor P [Candidatus Polarisedimenticolia bacterium]